jgi:hypothetical protein
LQQILDMKGISSVPLLQYQQIYFNFIKKMPSTFKASKVIYGMMHMDY